MVGKLKRLTGESAKILYIAYLRFEDDDGWAIASHIALSILMSMFPFLIFLTALAGAVGSRELADRATEAMLSVWPATVVTPISDEIHAVVAGYNTSTLTVGIVLSIYFSSNAVQAMRIGLNRAYDVQDRRSWWLLRLESIAYVFIGAFSLLALGLLLVLGPTLWRAVLNFAPDLVRLNKTVDLFRYGTVAILTSVSLVIAHKYIAAGFRSFRSIFSGVALTLIVCLIFAEGFGTYLTYYSSNYVATYAGLSSVMISLVFLYSLATIFLYGAELNQAIISAHQEKILRLQKGNGKFG